MQNLNSAYNSFGTKYDEIIKSILDKLDANPLLRPYKEQYYDNNKSVQKIMNDPFLKFLPLFIIIFIIIIIIVIILLVVRKKKKKIIKKYNNFAKPVDLYINYDKQKNDSINMNYEYFLRNSITNNLDGIPNNILYYNKFDNRDIIKSNEFIYNNLFRSI
tara:strand:- start:4890 stop:5369 length:480 start_codon:yes stop_codon:yes gene_type:complete